jgi:uncharacterized membrane protein
MALDRASYVAAFVAASLAYIFVTLAFVGEFDVTEWFAFVVSFLLLFYLGERAFIRWSEE